MHQHYQNICIVLVFNPIMYNRNKILVLLPILSWYAKKWQKFFRKNWTGPINTDPLKIMTALDVKFTFTTKWVVNFLHIRISKNLELNMTNMRLIKFFCPKNKLSKSDLLVISNPNEYLQWHLYSFNSIKRPEFLVVDTIAVYKLYIPASSNFKNVILLFN